MIDRNLIFIFPLFLLSAPALGQLTAEQTGVPTEVLQQTFEDYMSFSFSHGQLCQKTLKQTAPGATGVPQDLTIDLNVAGIITSKWKQEVSRADGTKPVIWRFECVSQIRPERKLVVLSLVMYEQRGAERRGVELLTKRDVRIVHEPSKSSKPKTEKSWEALAPGECISAPADMQAKGYSRLCKPSPTQK